MDYAANVHSQYGEDGILAKILELLPVKDRWSVEFGAWDGEHLSNTYALVSRGGYSAVFIEADRNRYADLVQRFSGNKNVISVNTFVGFGANDSLDRILADKPIPEDFDVLSIDIDGNDYHVWNAMSVYTPKIVCIEFNQTIPTEVEFVQPADPQLNQGASLLSLVGLGRRKGYELVCVTHNNAIFVRSAYFPLLGISNNEPRTLREDVSAVTYLFSGYDGRLFVRGREFLGHHDIRIANRLRQLPKCFRSYPPNFGRLTRWSYKVYRRVTRLLGRA